jgi:hypothetical protein
MNFIIYDNLGNYMALILLGNYFLRTLYDLVKLISFRVFSCVFVLMYTAIVSRALWN